MANPPKTRRNRRIRELIKKGATYSEVARSFGLTKGRIFQIVRDGRPV